MNGISLLLVLATVGTTAQVELGPSGQATYTIRIESFLLDQMLQGEEIKTNVGVKDRQVKRFRILATPESSSRNSGFQVRDSAPRAETLVEYQAVQLENNEIEMWVQIAPERLASLATRPIEGEIAADVPEVHRFRIFAGVDQLPQQPPAVSSTARDAQPPYLLSNNQPGQQQGGISTTGAEIRTSEPATRGTAPPLRSGAYAQNSTASNNRILSGNASDGRTTTWRNGPDPTTISPPPADRFGTSQPATQGYSTDSRFGSATGISTPGNRLDDQYSQQNYNDRNAPYPYGTANNAPTQQQLYNSNAGLTNPAYIPPQTTLAARPENQISQPQVPAMQAPATGGWVQTPANPATVAAPTAAVPATAVAVPTAIPVKASEEESKPTTSTPLILTTLALFTSLGVNTYLGWLAWSFFWRYRDAVNDSARARSYNSPGRQAA